MNSKPSLMKRKVYTKKQIIAIPSVLSLLVIMLILKGESFQIYFAGICAMMIVTGLFLINRFIHSSNETLQIKPSQSRFRFFLHATRGKTKIAKVFLK